MDTTVFERGTPFLIRRFRVGTWGKDHGRKSVPRSGSHANSSKPLRNPVAEVGEKSNASDYRSIYAEGHGNAIPDNLDCYVRSRRETDYPKKNTCVPPVSETTFFH